MASGPATIVAVLGVLACRAAYVPLSTANPDARLRTVLADAEVAVVVTDELGASRPAVAGRPIVTVGAAEVAQHPVPGAAAFGAAVRIEAGPIEARPEDPAYVIYTSGSTGEPKGVVVEHAQLAASTAARRQVYRAWEQPGGAVFLMVSPLSFDSSVAGIFGTLTAGGRLIVATGEQARDPDALVQLIAEHGVSQLLCVPTLYAAVLNSAARAGGDLLRSLRVVTTAGEALPQDLLDRHFAVAASAERSVALVNEYGPTETTVWASFQVFCRPAPVSIGGPVPGVELRVCDDTGAAVHRGEIGELYVGGAGVTRGYLGRPDASAAVFGPEPGTVGAAALWYRTGDLVRWNDQDRLDFVGRRDNQVKVGGHRVELGAVEVALRSLAGVREAAAVVDGAATIVGFVVAPEGLAIDEARRQLAEQLPSVMVPRKFRILGKLPLTANGKLDRRALQGMAAERPGTSSSGWAATTTEVVAKVSAAWAETLGVSEVPRNVNFFDLGGNSLAVFTLRDALERHVGARPSVVNLFQHTTVAAQAQLLSGAGEESATATLSRDGAAARRARLLRERRVAASSPSLERAGHGGQAERPEQPLSATTEGVQGR